MVEKPKLKNNPPEKPPPENQSVDEDLENNKTRSESQEGQDVDDEPYEEDNFAPYDPEKINISTKLMTIDLLLKRINQEEINLTPDFQRHAGIWTNDVKSRLIESIIVRIPLPAFYMDATNEDKWLIVDGLQRLHALKEFVIDKTLQLTGLEFLDNIKGKRYDEIGRKYQRRIEETQVTVYLIDKGTPDRVKYNLFGRINTGGLPLTPQELRHALNPGEAPKFLRELSELKEFQDITRLSPSRIDRMEDRELVLRFLAFKFTEYKQYPKDGNLKIFLNLAMKQINQKKPEERKKIAKEFQRVMKASLEIFGQYAFRRTTNANKNRIKFNRSLFEVWSVSLSNLSDSEIERLKYRKSKLIEEYQNVLNDSTFDISISKSPGKFKNVQYRFREIEELIEDILR